MFLWVLGQRTNLRSELAAGALRTFFFFLLYFSVIGRYGNAESKAFGCIGEYSFLPNTSARALVATERLSQCVLLMECPRLLRVELNMLFGGVDAP